MGTQRRTGAVCALVIAACGAVAPAWGQSDGSDVILEDIHEVVSFALGATRAYAIGSTTCNIGDEVLPWGESADGSPALAMNMYELSNGRLRQIGQGWCKTSSLAFPSGSCGFACGPAVLGSQLGSGCRDVYGANFNAVQSRMAPRSSISAFTGAMIGPVDGGSGAVERRLQVPHADMKAAGLLFLEGVYVSTADAMDGHGLNNASYRRMTLNGFFQPVLEDTTQSTLPAIHAWRQYGAGVDDDGGIADTSVEIVNVDVANEGRFVAGANVVDNGDGTWTYNYAVFNLNSDRAGGALRVPVGAGASVSGLSSHAPQWHSGEIYDNTPWVPEVDADSAAWRTAEAFGTDPNANAIRWGTMHTFWFQADTAPESGSLELSLFAPGSPGSVSWVGPVPSAASVCPCEFGGSDETITVEDLLGYLALWFEADPAAEITGDVPVDVDVQDLLEFLACWFPASTAACP